MNFPISIISHSSTIPANSPDYVEKFEKIEFPNRDLFDLRITSITAKVDTTSPNVTVSATQKTSGTTRSWFPTNTK